MTRHPWLRWLTIALAILVGLFVALMAFLFLFQPTLNLSPFKHRLEDGLSGLAGSPVTLQEIYLKTSLQPRVEVRGLQVADAASVETTRLEIELIPLLRRHISIRSLNLDQVMVQLQPTLELVKDWLEREDRPKSPFRVDALENLELDRVQVNLTDAQGDDHRLTIDDLDGGVSRSSPLQLKARGNFDDVALQLEATGPTLEELFAPDTALPLAASLEFAGLQLSVEGTLTKRPGQLALTLGFTLEGDDLQATLAATEVEVPSLGPFRLQGNLEYSGGPIHFSNLEGRIDEANLSGDLRLSFDNKKIALAGSLETGRIDLEPWLEPRPAMDDPDLEEAGSGHNFIDRPLPAEPIERALAAMDVDLEVASDGLDGLPTTIEELTGRLNLQNGRMTLHYGLQLAQAPVQGQVEVESTQGLLELALDLSSSRLPLDQLMDDLGQGLTTGTVGQVHLAASSSGNTVGDLFNQLAFDLETGDAQIRFRSPDTDKKVDLVLTHMEVRRSPETPLQAILDGDLRGYPYRIELNGQETKDWRSDDPWPFILAAEGLGGRTWIEGRLSPEPGGLSLDVELDIAGDRIGDLEPWWGVPAEADYPYEVHGHLRVEPDRSKLDLDLLRVGHTTATMTLLVPPQEEAPILVDLHAPTVALDELMRLVESSQDEDFSPEDILTVDIPIWAEELTLPDTKVHLELDQVLRSSPGLADFSDVVADLVILQSHLESVTFSARAEEARFRGGLALAWQTEPPEMSLEIGGEALDLGRLVALDEIAPDLVVRVGRFDLQVTATQQTLRQMFLEGASLSGKAEDVFLSVPSLDGEDRLELTLGQAVISETPTHPIQVSAEGLIRELPFELDLRLRNKDRTEPEGDQIPIEMALRTGDIHLDAHGNLTLPASANNLDLGFTLTADRISSFEPFLGHRLSEVGPVAATGDLAIRPESYTVGNLSLEVGESDVSGDVSLDLAGPRPRIAADLSSRRIHLAELFGGTSTSGEVESKSARGSPEPDDISEEEEVESWLERIESSKLGNLDLDLNLQADDVYWGGETGGGGRVRVQLEEGRFTAGPFRLALADGYVEGLVTLLADDGLVDVDIGLDVDNVAYGPILRFFDETAEGKGKVDLQTRLVTTSAPVGQLITAATGDFRFAVFPHEIDTALLDLWGAGLVRSMFRLVDPTSESILNCIAGDFSVAEGQMTANNFWFDTSRIRARGKGSIDLETMTLDMTLRPRPKKRTFLSLATPAKIKGPIEDPSIKLAKGGLVRTGFRLYMWWLTIYAQVFKKPLPTDGSDVCFLPPPAETVEQPSGESAAPPSN